MTTALAFLFVLGVLVFVHELGHFLVARWYGVRVHTFSLGFGPKLLKFRRGDTEYCVSAIPLGGYVKLAGETVEDALTGAPDEFLSKSKWIRFQVYLAGPVMNLLLAVVVLAGVLAQGADVPLFESSAVVVGTIDADSPAEKVGLRPHDRIVAVNGEAIADWTDFGMAVMPRGGRETTLSVERDGQRIEVPLTPSVVGRYEMGHIGIQPPHRPQIVQVNPGSPAERAGLQRGDVIVGVGATTEPARDAVITSIRGSAGSPLPIAVERAGRQMTLDVVPEGPSGAGLIGVLISPYEVRRIDPTLVQAVKMSVQQNWEGALLIGRTIGGLFTAETPVRQLMGPVAIAELSGDAARLGWAALLNLMVMISLNLGLLNLMPVPVLDGGHIAILAVEGLARRDLSSRVKERILMAGAAVIVLLMVTVIYNDVSRLLR